MDAVAVAPGQAMTDASIWTALRDMQERTGWPPSAIIDAVAMEHNLDRDRVSQVWRERVTRTGAG